MDATPTDFLEGHLRIISSREVELADATLSKMTAENYPDYPLVIQEIMFWMFKTAGAGTSAHAKTSGSSSAGSGES